MPLTTTPTARLNFLYSCVVLYFQCSSSCGRGFQRRKLKCTYQRFNGEYKRVKAGKCDGVKKPEVTFKKTCFVNACSEITNRSVPILTSPTTSRNNNHDEIARNYQLTAQWMAGGWQKVRVETCSLGYFQTTVMTGV